MRILTFIPVLLIWCVSSLHGQTIIKALPRWMVSSQVIYMKPQSPVDRFLDHDDWGYHIETMYRLQYNKPFLAGLYFSEVGLSRYTLKYTERIDGEDVDIKEKANTRRLDFGICAGFYPEINAFIQPYVVGRLGMAVFQSSSVLTDRDEGEIIDRIPEMGKVVPSYSLDVGVHVIPNIWYIRFDARVGIVANPSVTFLSLDKENAGETGYPIDYFKEHTSSATWIKWSVGATYIF